MKLLQGGVKVAVPAFEIATETGVHQVKFSILFARQSEKERKARIKKSFKSMRGAKKMAESLEGNEDDEALMEEIQDNVDATEIEFDKKLFADIIGWESLIDIDGSDVPYSVSEKKALLESPPFRGAILGVWSMATGGVTPVAENEADTKN